MLTVSRPNRPPSPEADPKTLRIAAAVRGLFDALGLPRTDPHLCGTEIRMAKAYRDLLAGLQPGAEPSLTTFANAEGYGEMVAVVGIPLYSLCAHHFLPFFGTAHVAYLPADRLVGLSKLARVVEFFARRPQVQERLTEQVADFLEDRLSPRGVMVVLEARHLCIEMRGVDRPGLVTTTTATRGALAEDRWRGEFLARISHARVAGPHPAGGD